MSVCITCLTDEIKISETFSKQLIKAVDLLLEEYNLAGGEVGIILSDDQYLASLNKKYRNKDAPTDVLSFSFLETADDKVEGVQEFAVGDIYISVERALEQKEQAGHSLEKEVFLLAVHGMLHLLGFDHDDEKDKHLMQNKEKELLNEFAGN